MVRLPLRVWVSMVRVGFRVPLCESVVAVQELAASPVGESDVCAQSARLEQKYTPMASNISWRKRAVSDVREQPFLLGRPMPAARAYPSRSEIFVARMPIFFFLPANIRCPDKAKASIRDSAACGGRRDGESSIALKKGHPEKTQDARWYSHLRPGMLSLYSPGGFCCSRFCRSSSCFFSAGVCGR